MWQQLFDMGFTEASILLYITSCVFSHLVNVGGMHVPDFLLFIHAKLSLIHMKFIWLVESRHAGLFSCLGIFPFLSFLYQK